MCAKAGDLECSIHTWLLQKGVLEPAPYQRPYSWDESLVTSFVDAICSDECSDIGLVIVESTGSNGAYFIADGQQRLVTFALMLKACGVTCDASSRMGSLIQSAGKNVESVYRRAQA